jgi:hypothetical protein
MPAFESKQAQSVIEHLPDIHSKPHFQPAALVSSASDLVHRDQAGNPVMGTLKRVPKKIDVVGQQSAGYQLVQDLPPVPIPDEDMGWAQVRSRTKFACMHSCDPWNSQASLHGALIAVPFRSLGAVWSENLTVQTGKIGRTAC